MALPPQGRNKSEIMAQYEVNNTSIDTLFGLDLQQGNRHEIQRPFG